MEQTPSGQLQKDKISKSDLRLQNWIPLALLALPTAMIAIPLLVQIPPKLAMYFTPPVPLLFQIALILYALRAGLLRNLPRPSNHPVVAAVVLFFMGVVAYTSAWVAIDSFYSVIKIFDLMLFTGVSFSAAFLFAKAGRRLILLSVMALFAAVLIAVPIETFLIANRVPEYYWWPLFIPGFDHIRIYGFSLTASISVGTGLLALPVFQEPLRRWALIAGLAVLWATLFWSSSRGGILAWVLVTPTIAILVPALRKPLIYSVIALLVGAGVSSQFKGETKDTGFNNTVSEIVTPESVTGFGDGRIRDWSRVLGSISERPLFGHGYAQSYALGLKPETGIVHTHTIVHTHNIVLEAIQAWGIIGGGAAGFLIIWLWFVGLKRTRSGDLPEQLPAFLTVSVLLIYAWVDGTYFYYQSLIPLAICTAVLMVRPNRPRET